MSRAGRRGAAAIEYALVLPVLLVVIFGLLDWSVYMTRWMHVRVAAGRGVRLAAGAPADPEAAAVAAACVALQAHGLGCTDVVAQQEPGDPDPVLRLTVVVPFAAPLGLVPTPTTLEASATTAWYGWIYAEN